MDIRKAIDTTPMGGFQWYLIGLATFLNALDGYDVLAMAFTATSVTEEFGLTGSQLGLLLSSGLIGMALGSLILGPFADRLGRRRILILALSINLLGLVLSATAGSAVEATLGGALATQLIPAFGWRSVFAAGAAATLFSLVLVIVSIPESVDYLRVKRPAGAEAKMEKIARRLGKTATPGIAASAAGVEPEQVKLSSLLTGQFKLTTYKLWAAFFIIMFGFYFANTWTPQLLVESGMTENQGIIGGLALTLGGTFGSLLYGVITIRFDARHTLMVFSVLSATTLVVFITTTSIPALAFLSGVLVGMLINGCVAGLYTVTPAAYPSELRTTGVGWGIGVGRFGAIFAPITVGALLDAGWTPVYLYTGVAVVVVLAAVALIGIKPYLGGKESGAAGQRASVTGEDAEPAAVS